MRLISLSQRIGGWCLVCLLLTSSAAPGLRGGRSRDDPADRNGPTYLGSFRVPRHDKTSRWVNDSTMSYSFGGYVAAVDADGDELWLAGHAQRLLIGKVSIPDNPVKPSTKSAFKELPIAQATRPLFDITQGQRNASVQDSHWAMVLGDLLPMDEDVHWVLHHRYNVSQTPYRVLGSYDTETGSASGPYEFVYQNGRHLRDQLSGGYVLRIPEPWAGVVGGHMAAGGGGLPGQAIIGGGPSLYAFNPPPEGANAKEREVKVQTLLQYPWDNDRPLDERRRFEGWNRASKPFDAVWIGDTVLVAVRIAEGPVWYGEPDGPGDLYDWYNINKGYHAAHYEMRLLFYHASDLAAVSQNLQQAWEPQPYANVLVPHLMGPDVESQFRPVSLSWNPKTHKLYLVQTWVDRSRSPYAYNPVVHVYDMGRPDALKRWARNISGKHPILRRRRPTLR